MARSADMRFDIAVIGAGAAGLSITAVAAQLGLKVALIERARMGGECLNTGCVPSKALLAAAHAAEAARQAGRFGIRLSEPQIDWDAVRSHVQDAVASIAPMDSEARFGALGATVLRGEARFLGPDRLTVDGRCIAARRIVIATGSRPAIPPIPGLDRVPFLTNETLFAMRDKPTHLLILGGGPIGLENQTTQTTEPAPPVPAAPAAAVVEAQPLGALDLFSAAGRSAWRWRRPMLRWVAGSA